jgi:hypothetical protein
MPVTFVSGHADALLALRLAIVRVARLLTKPVQRATLVCALTEFLR